jgi:hypothetical protein
MLDWLFGRKRRDEEFLMGMMRAAAEGDRLHRLRQAIATVSTKPLYGKEATEHAASAAALLTAAIVSETISAVEDDDDRFTAGVFAFAFSDYFALLLAGNFEIAASLAVMMVVGTEEFDRCFNAIQESYNRIVQSKVEVIKAIGTTCDAWFKNPSPSQFERLAELFKLLRSRVVQK